MRRQTATEMHPKANGDKQSGNLSQYVEYMKDVIIALYCHNGLDLQWSNQLQDPVVANIATKTWLWCLQERDILL